MMRTGRFALVLAVVVFAIAFGVWYLSRATPEPQSPAPQPPTPALPAAKDDLIAIDAPLPQTTVRSPLTITGKARGTWYFEAQFPVKIYDANHTLLGSTAARAQGDWMTSEYVSFSATLSFTAPSTATGTLVLEKDNPSGDPARADELPIPVVFDTAR